MLPARVHEWRDTTEDGEWRYFRAARHLGRWQFAARLKSEEDWSEVAAPSLEDLRALRELLWRKYQRRRLPWEQVAEIDAMIEATGE